MTEVQHGKSKVRDAVTKKDLHAGFSTDDRSLFFWLRVRDYDSNSGIARVCEYVETCNDHEAERFRHLLGTGDLVERSCFVPGGVSYALVTAA